MFFKKSFLEKLNTKLDDYKLNHSNLDSVTLMTKDAIFEELFIEINMQLDDEISIIIEENSNF